MNRKDLKINSLWSLVDVSNGKIHFIASILFFVLLSSSLIAQKNKIKPQPPLSIGQGGNLVYNPDEKGNRIPDYSYAGYMAGETVIPDAPVKVFVPWMKGDATNRIQSAINHVASLPADKDGVRGAVLLDKGIHEIKGSLYINDKGVVLRGSGTNENGTVLYGAGTDRETLIALSGSSTKELMGEVNITDSYVPVNSTKLHVSSGNQFKAGDMVIVRRPSNQRWIDSLGTAHFGGGITSLGWKPGQRDLYFDRKIISIDGNELTLDAPITSALDTTYGISTINAYIWPGRLTQVGIENLRLRSAVDPANPKDEDHRWMAITFENAADCWIRRVTFEKFAGSAVAIYETSKRITVEDCKSLSPVSEIGGQRRYTFFTNGQQILFQRCYAENGYHDFAVGYCAAGPNAFVQCHSQLPYSFSGAIDSWASGTLFDIVNVDGQALRFGNRGQDGQGAGWCGANSMLYQCTASLVECDKPPTANNWAYGTWAQFQGDGYWAESNNSIQPRSLYYAQLEARLGRSVRDRSYILPLKTEASSSPEVSVAMQLTAESNKPQATLLQWIDELANRNPIQISKGTAKTIGQLGTAPTYIPEKVGVMKVDNGWLMRGSGILTGRRLEVPWWNGSSRPHGLKEAKPHITRFVPGRTGKGLTDNLYHVANDMVEKNVIAIEHNYGLWYERRRDDHERIRRMDGEVWPPFYELPFARSGKELAWDGLSKYDLTKYNSWYWSRLKKFADIADERGLLLVHQNYFQHNIIEAGAHYADFPWRTANNINSTGFPEPPPYAGDKRIFMAEQFYDINNPLRKKLHTAYIRKCLDNFSENSGVIQLIGAEFTGPTHFVRFWLKTIGDWEKEKGKKEIIGLSTTKDVQDSILADPALAAIVDLIDIRQWHYQADGNVYAPKGGQNLAPRQHARLLKPKKTSFEQVFRAVFEYKTKYPSKAVIYSGDSEDQFGWAVFMAGGSLAAIPKIEAEGFLEAAYTMKLVPKEESNTYVLKNKNNESIIYNLNGGEISFQPLEENYVMRVINARNGALELEQKMDGGKILQYKSTPADMIIWISKK